MKKHSRTIIASVSIFAVLLAAAAAFEMGQIGFSRSTIDLGIVVKDIDASAKFYTEALGFTEIGGFDVSKELAGDSGLVDYMPFHVRQFVLKDEPTATHIKIMSFPDAKPKKVNNKYINSSFGFSYLTIHTTDTKAAVARIKAAGLKPVKEPYPINDTTYLTLIKDPDGNIIELVGP